MWVDRDDKRKNAVDIVLSRLKLEFSEVRHCLWRFHFTWWLRYCL